MAVSESRQMAALLTGMSLALYITNRLEAYFVFYQRLPAVLATDNFEKALIEIYAHVLHFTAIAIQTYQRSAASRTWRALWETSALEEFEKECDKLGSRTEIEASNCDRELSARDWTNAKQWKADLDRTLQKLDDIQGIRETVNALHVEVNLTKLKTAAGATYNSHEDEHAAQCLAGTRTALLDQIAAWADDPNGKCIFWLCGMAGTGKSTISRTVAHNFDKKISLGGSFFFKRGEGDRGTAKLFFPTLVRQLLDRVAGPRQSVAQNLEADSFLCERNLQDQFEKLLLEPFTVATQRQHPRQCLAVVIDALDECERKDDVRNILRLLARVDAIGSLRLRIFVTSRPELPIQIGFRSMSGDLHRDVMLEEVQASTITHDIRAFFDQKFTDIKTERLLKRPFDPLPADWPTEGDMQTLVSLALPLFIFASTIYRFVSESSPQRRLELILKQQDSQAYSGLAKTYLPILEQLIAGKEEALQHKTIADFRDIVGPIVLVADPLSVASLSSLLQLDREVIDDHLEHLHSVLHVPPEPHQPIRLLHLSFRDFLVDCARSDRDGFWIDEARMHSKLTSQCLQLLSRPGVLSRDLCSVIRPGTRRADIGWQLVTSCISPDVAYACRYWVWHVLESKDQLLDNGHVHIFLQEHFLPWLEALSWLGRFSGAIAYISQLQSLVYVSIRPMSR